MNRGDFPMLKDESLIYFDSAATALKPQCVIDAVSRYYSEECGTVHRGVYRLAREASDRYHAVREQAACFLNAASSDEIVFTSGTTEGINLIASSFGLKAGDEVVVAETEHHSNIVPWQLVCDRVGAKLRVIPVDDAGNLQQGPFGERTKIVSVAHICNSLGIINPIEEVIRLARQVGAAVVVDGAQAVSHLKVDVQALDADFYLFSGHKLYGPTGIGVLYGKRERLEALTPYQGGGDMIERVTFEKTTFNTLPHRLEAGTPNIAGVMGLGSAISYVEGVGLEAIEAHENALRQHALDSLPATVLGKPSSSIVSFTIEGVHPLDIGTLLDLKNIAIRTGHHCAQPTMDRLGISSSCRLSFGLYNTSQEIDRFVEILKDVVKITRQK